MMKAHGVDLSDDYYHTSRNKTIDTKVVEKRQNESSSSDVQVISSSGPPAKKVRSNQPAQSSPPPPIEAFKSLNSGNSQSPTIARPSVIKTTTLPVVQTNSPPVPVSSMFLFIPFQS